MSCEPWCRNSGRCQSLASRKLDHLRWGSHRRAPERRCETATPHDATPWRCPSPQARRPTDRPWFASSRQPSVWRSFQGPDTLPSHHPRSHTLCTERSLQPDVFRNGEIDADDGVAGSGVAAGPRSVSALVARRRDASRERRLGGVGAGGLHRLAVTLLPSPSGTSSLKCGLQTNHMVLRREQRRSSHIDRSGTVSLWVRDGRVDAAGASVELA